MVCACAHLSVHTSPLIVCICVAACAEAKLEVCVLMHMLAYTVLCKSLRALLALLLIWPFFTTVSITSKALTITTQQFSRNEYKTNVHKIMSRNCAVNCIPVISCIF